MVISLAIFVAQSMRTRRRRCSVYQSSVVILSLPCLFGVITVDYVKAHNWRIRSFGAELSLRALLAILTSSG